VRKLRLRIWEFPDSNLGPDTGCFDKCLWFFSVHRDECRDWNFMWQYLLTPIPLFAIKLPFDVT